MQESNIYENEQAVDRKQQFRERMLNRIRSGIGFNNKDQQLKETVLLDICLKITSIYVRCLEEIENEFGEEIWGYKLPPDIFDQLPEEEQQRMRLHSQKWRNSRAVIRSFGNDVINHIINKFGFLSLDVMNDSFSGQICHTPEEAKQFYNKKIAETKRTRI